MSIIVSKFWENAHTFTHIAEVKTFSCEAQLLGGHLV